MIIRSEVFRSCTDVNASYGSSIENVNANWFIPCCCFQHLKNLQQVMLSGHGRRLLISRCILLPYDIAKPLESKGHTVIVTDEGAG